MPMAFGAQNFIHLLEAGATDLTPEMVAAWQKEFLMVMRNIPSKVTRETLPVLQKAVRSIRDKHDQMISLLYQWEKSKKTDLESYRATWWQFIVAVGRVSNDMGWEPKQARDFEKHLADLKQRHPDSDWDDYFRNKPEPTQEDLDARHVEEIKKKLVTSKRAAMRSARTFWKDILALLEWKELDGLTLTVARENVSLEGLNYVFVGHTHEGEGGHADYSAETAIKRLGPYTRYYRERAEQMAPALLKWALPVYMFFREDDQSEVGGDAAANYAYDRINFGWWAIHSGSREKFAHVMAHEMGHHIFKKLPESSQQAWSAFINDDIIQLDVEEVISRMREDESDHAFSKRMSREDPNLVIQLEALHYFHGTSHLEVHGITSFVRAYREGKLPPTLRVPANPITSYGNKNTEEAFCEALGKLVAYGNSKVPVKIRTVLRRILRPTDGYPLPEGKGFVELFNLP